MPGPSAALVAAMLAYASQVSGLPIPSDMPPPVVAMSTHRIVGHYASGEPWAAMTDTATGAVTLQAGWRASNAEDRCVLGHELVHRLQVANGLHFDPIERAEPLAYAFTAKCFEAYHLPRQQIAWAWRQVAKFSR